ncbi:uncharacterized protein [Haliotis asinina]|uniref:uncharacterized protein n=1 Tax=Haliotis asinina TaxID=109174 RepID=UPI003531E09D
MSAESCGEMIHIHEGQENLDESRHDGYESIDERKPATSSHNDPDNDILGSLEYHYIDDSSPPSDHQVHEESQPEANDYEDIGGTTPHYDYIQAINEPLTLTSKCKKATLFLVPIFASLTLNIIAGFYTSLMFHAMVLPGKISFEDGEMSAEVGITFIVFSALAAASCAPLIIRFGFRKVSRAGSVLLICSSLSSSVTTTADILSFIMGGLAVGHLQTLGVVAIGDHLCTRQTLAFIVSHAGFTLGNIGSIFGLKRYDCYIDRRLFEISGVMGLIAGCCLQKTPQAQANVPMLFKHPSFYFLISIGLVTPVGLSILQAEIIMFDYTVFIFVSQLLVLSVLVITWIFQKKKLKESFLFSMGMSVVALGLVAMVHQDVLDSRAAVVTSSLMLGSVVAFSQVMLPVALVNTAGRRNLNLALPLLVCLDCVGRLIGGSIRASISATRVNAAMYRAGVPLVIAGVWTITSAVVIKRWPPLSNEREAEDQVPDQVQEAEDQVPDQVQEAEGRVEDRVQGTEDRVEDQVQEAQDCADDRVQDVEQHVKLREDEAEK